jgi:hypothetical protein
VSPALAHEVKDRLNQMQGLLRGLGVDLDLDDTTCEVIVKKGKVIGYRIVFDTEIKSEAMLHKVVGFVERNGYGEVKVNGTMTRATVMLSLMFPNS